MRHSTAVILIMMLLVAQEVAGQDSQTSAEVESTSYQLYSAHRWNELISYGRNALENGFDYFYLRNRLGQAYYYRGFYRIATVHFEKALAFNRYDETNQEYLYYSLLNAARFDEARLFSETCNPALVAKLGKNSWSPVHFITAEGGVKLTSNILYDPAYYFQLGVEHSFGNRVSFFHAVTSYYQAESRGTISQLQYFIQATIPLRKHWLLSPSLHMVQLNFLEQGTNYPYSSYVASLFITRSTPFVDLSLGTSYSTVLIRPQYIQHARLTIYPFGKPNFSIGTSVYIHWEDNTGAPVSQTSAFKVPSPITVALNPFVQWSPSQRFGLYANYLTNKTDNIVEMNGYLINNSPDLTTSRFSIMGSFELSRRWSLYGVYQHENKEVYNSFNYSYNVFLLGLKFKPL